MRISNTYLAKVLKSNEFMQAISLIGDVTHRTGYETQLIVYRYLKTQRAPPSLKDIEIAEMIVGSCFSGNVNFEETKRFEKKDYIPPEFAYLFMNLHFHPGYEGPIIPSGFEGDLEGLNGSYKLNESKGIEAKPISVICQIDSQRNIELLLIQQKNFKPIPHSLIIEFDEFYDEMLEGINEDSIEDKVTNQSRIVECFNGSGLYNAEYFRYKNGRYYPYFSKKLKAFEFDEMFDQKKLQDFGLED